MLSIVIVEGNYFEMDSREFSISDGDYDAGRVINHGGFLMAD